MEDKDQIKMDHFYIECFVRKLKDKRIIVDYKGKEHYFESDGIFHVDDMTYGYRVYLLYGKCWTLDKLPMVGHLGIAGTLKELEKMTGFVINPIRCECGGDKSGGTHSTWCPKYGRKDLL